MPGGTLTAIIRKQSFFMLNIDNDKKGRWSAIVMKAKGKKVVIITLHRLPDRNTEGICTAKAQFDKTGKKVKLVKQY